MNAEGVTPLKTAQILRELRLSRNMSQDDVAKSLGIDRTTYVKYEHGGSIKRNLPRLADFFGVSTDYLLGRSENSKKLSYTPILHEDCPKSGDTNTAPYHAYLTSHALPRSEHEVSLLSKYRELKPEHQKAVDIQVDYFHGIDNKQDSDI